MHKSELKTHPTLINSVIKEYKLKVGTIGTHRSTSSLIIKFEIDSTTHYRESTAL